MPGNPVYTFIRTLPLLRRKYRLFTTVTYVSLYLDVAHCHVVLPSWNTVRRNEPVFANSVHHDTGRSGAVSVIQEVTGGIEGIIQ